MKRAIMPLSELLAAPRSDRIDARKLLELKKDNRRSSRRSRIFETLNEGIEDKAKP